MGSIGSSGGGGSGGGSSGGGSSKSMTFSLIQRLRGTRDSRLSRDSAAAAAAAASGASGLGGGGGSGGRTSRTRDALRTLSYDARTFNMTGKPNTIEITKARMLITQKICTNTLSQNSCQ